MRERGTRSSRALLCLALGLAGACANAPEPSRPGTATLWGEVRLVPREGVEPGRASGGGYGDRRLRDVVFVDYSRPGFAVVFLEERPPPAAGVLELFIQSSDRGRIRIQPGEAAIGAGGTLRIQNQTGESHVLSSPRAKALRSLAPGEVFEIAQAAPGVHELYVLDASDARATVFAAPGPFAQVSRSGRFELRDVAPGPVRLRVWHPRFPPASLELEVRAGTVARVDLEMKVAGLGGADAAARPGATLPPHHDHGAGHVH